MPKTQPTLSIKPKNKGKHIGEFLGGGASLAAPLFKAGQKRSPFEERKRST